MKVAFLTTNKKTNQSMQFHKYPSTNYYRFCFHATFHLKRPRKREKFKGFTATAHAAYTYYSHRNESGWDAFLLLMHLINAS